MNTVIICKSIHHGNTMEVAEEMAGVLGCKIKGPGEIEDVEDFDLVGFGSGIYYQSFHEDIVELVEELDSGVKVFIFSTSGMPNIPLLHDFEGKLKRKLKENGFEVLRSFNCRGYDDYGPLKYIGGVHSGRPNEEDLEDAKNFAREIKEMVEDE